MTDADDILKAITDRKLGVGHYEVKRLVNAGNWLELGRIFNFTPVMHSDTKHYIDWNCVPKSLKDMLYAIPPQARVPKSKARSEIVRNGKVQVSTRLRLFRLQKGVCYYCRQVTKYEKWTVDHKTPKSRGGTGKTNLTGACWSCNNRKGDRTEAEFREAEKKLAAKFAGRNGITKSLCKTCEQPGQKKE